MPHFNEDTTPSPLLPHGGYRKLRSYKIALIIHDATVIFCRRFLPSDRRTTDQMVQAARSGVRNISEASGAAATSRKTEMKLTNVARASLADELLLDYESFLRQNALPIWPKDSPKARAMRQRLRKDDDTALLPEVPGSIRLKSLDHLADFVSKTTPEIAANALICALHQATYLLKRQLDAQAKEFTQHGGFTENLYNTRVQARTKTLSRRAIAPSSSSDQLEPSDKSDPSDPYTTTPPTCPTCAHPMTLRTARQGPNTGQHFWGCTNYPNCRTTLPLSQDPNKDSK